MTKDQLAHLLESEPFRPVVITTTSGDHFEVLQERNVHYNSRFRPDRVVVFTPDGQFHILDADQIASATVL
jgi:hypothetical protein